ncbi:hypothetical protein JG687_00014705 [Phytophthora cactorum]|uniref:Uncharacterized protein n=1 Tax=Phytophthora cactorum TaxID=29920 RepID=A0A8T1U0V7_9STRA|nr:hypothetical protein JG687_00014705 [Phytophthora cactorum]
MQSTEHATGEVPCLHSQDHPKVIQSTDASLALSTACLNNTPRTSDPLRARLRTPTSGGPRPPAPRRTTSSPLEPDQFQLVVKPTVKNSVGQRETSGDTLSNFLVDGSAFQDILGKLWEKFSHRIKRRSVKQDGVWSMEPSAMLV